MAGLVIAAIAGLAVGSAGGIWSATAVFRRRVRRRTEAARAAREW